MGILTYTILGIAGLMALLVLYAVLLLIGRSVGALVAWGLTRQPRSAHHAARYGARATIVTLSLLMAYIGYSAYEGVYPSAGFYLDEMKRVTARPPPAEAKVLAQDSTYPDFHGDYCSFSRIRLSDQSYNKLLHELTTDQRFAVGPNGAISSGRMTANTLPPVRVVSSFVRTDVADDHHYTISFLQSDADIEVEICVT